MGFYLKIPALWSGLWNALPAIFTSTSIALAFSYFWICAGCAAWIKKVLPAAITSAGAVFLIFFGIVRLVYNMRILWPYPHKVVIPGFVIIALLFTVFFFLAISERERTAMSDSLTRTFQVDASPQRAYDAINDVRGWWSGRITGPTDQLGAEFSYWVPGIHYVKSYQILCQ